MPRLAEAMLRCFRCELDIDIDSSGDEDDKTEERREFKRDFLGMLEARIFELQERGRAVVLVSHILSFSFHRHVLPAQLISVFHSWKTIA